MECTYTLMTRLDWLFGEVSQFPVSQDLAVLRHEVLSLFFGKQVIVGLADCILVGNSDEFGAGLVKAHESKIPRIFDENHDGDVFDYRVREGLRALGFFLGVLALSDILGNPHQVLRSAFRIQNRNLSVCSILVPLCRV